MTYQLEKVVLGGYGRSDQYYTKAIANTVRKLEQYCIKEFGKPTGKPMIFNWDDYYIITSSSIKIIK